MAKKDMQIQPSSRLSVDVSYSSYLQLLDERQRLVKKYDDYRKISVQYIWNHIQDTQYP